MKTIQGILACCASVSLLFGSEAPSNGASAWVLATDAQGKVVSDLKISEWKLKIGGAEATLTQMQTPQETSQQTQNWFLVFMPIMDWKLRLNAFLASAQFIANIPQGDRVLIAARTKDGLKALTPGLTTDRLAWVQGLEKLPNALSNRFDGKDGVISPELEKISLHKAEKDCKPEEYVAALKAFLAQVPKAVKEGPYKEAEQPNTRIIDRLGLGNQAEVRAKLMILTNEMKSLETLIKSASRCAGAGHCVVFSNNDADLFTHPAISKSMRTNFKRGKGDEGGPSEAAELAVRDSNLARNSLKSVALESGITLHSIAGDSEAFGGFASTTATATGGLRSFFHNDMPKKLWENLLIYGSRYQLRWKGETKDLQIQTTRPGIQLAYPNR